jgi:uncharacterized protein YjdB
VDSPITVTIDDPTIAIGDTTRARAASDDPSLAYWISRNRRVRWSSADTSIATVDGTGLITAKGVGTVRIRVRVNGVRGRARLTVVDSRVATVTVMLAADTIAPAASTSASATLRDANGNVLSSRPIQWMSSNPAVAIVDAVTGNALGVAPGTTDIIAASEGVTGRATLTVAAAVQIPVASVAVTLGSSSLGVGQTTSATAVLRDASNNVLSGRAVSWSSTNTAVATVNASGVVTARAAGTSQITATSEAVNGSALLTVTAAPPPPSTTLAFASDWGTALGTSSTAILDGGSWDNRIDGGGPTNRLQVISALGLGFPVEMTNVLKVLYRNNDSEYWNVNVVGGWTLPPVGGSLYFRLYFRHDVAGSGGGMLHTVQTGPPGNCPYTAELQFRKVSSSQIDFVISHYGGSSSSSNAHDWTVRLNKNETYRVEEQYIRMGTNSWKVHARIYDGNNNLIKDDDDFVDQYTGRTMASWTGNITSATDCLRNKMIGNPGDGGGRGSTDTAHQHIYYGGFAVSHTGWIGPYRAGERP